MEFETMTFNTPQFVFTLVLFLICWFILPNAVKKPVLLLFSFYYAYLLGGIWSVIVLGAATLLTYLWALLLPNFKNKQTGTVIFTVLLILLLVYGRQIPGIWDLLSKFVDTETRSFTIGSMVGLSYYILSAISYIVDIYHGKDEPDKNFMDVAVWMSFFPKITAGPIERHSDFKRQLSCLSGSGFDIERIKRGMLICARGYFYKIIIADRIGIFVDSVYADFSNNHGFTIFITMIAYALQIYFDFAGYSLIAYGISHSIGLKITNNFVHPYFSESIREFWRRWHISLSSWLRDYIYIPLGGNRKGKIRQYLNIMITFMVSGLWHGSGLTFLVWGCLHGLFQIAESMTDEKVKLPKFAKILITFFMTSFAWVFFRSDSLNDAKIFFKRMLFWNPDVITDGTLTGFGLNTKNWIVLMISLMVVLFAEILQFHGISLYAKLEEKHIVIRWVVYYLIIVVLLVFGIYGPAFDSNNFIYLKF